MLHLALGIYGTGTEKLAHRYSVPSFLLVTKSFWSLMALVIIEQASLEVPLPDYPLHTFDWLTCSLCLALNSCEMRRVDICESFPCICRVGIALTIRLLLLLSPCWSQWNVDICSSVRIILVVFVMTPRCHRYIVASISIFIDYLFVITYS